MLRRKNFRYQPQSPSMVFQFRRSQWSHRPGWEGTSIPHAECLCSTKRWTTLNNSSSSGQRLKFLQAVNTDDVSQTIKRDQRQRKWEKLMNADEDISLCFRRFEKETKPPNNKNNDFPWRLSWRLFQTIFVRISIVFKGMKFYILQKQNFHWFERELLIKHSAVYLLKKLLANYLFLITKIPK